MIDRWGQRIDVNYPQEVHSNYPPRTAHSVGDAMLHFVKFELGYGGRVTNVIDAGEKICLEVQTRCMYKLDTTWFEGTKSEMEPLMRVTAHFLAFREHHTKDLVDLTAKKLIQNGLRTPLEIEMAGFMIFGDFSAKAAMISAMGAKTEEIAKRLIGYTYEDLCAAWELNSYRAEGMEGLLS